MKTAAHCFCACTMLLMVGAAGSCRAQEVAASGMMLAGRDAVGLPDAPSALMQRGSAPGGAEPGAPGQEAPAGETEAQRKARLHEEGDREVKQQEQQRIAVVVPNFNTVISGQGVALSKGQKTELALHATFDPFNLVGAVFLAAASEVTDSDRGFGWGPGGYFKRVGANLADVFTGTMLAGAVYPILLHQDPRFFRQGTGTKKSRARHALLAAVICRGDNGRRQPNFSNVLGNFSAGLLSNVYYPSSETGVLLAFENSSIVTVEGAMGNIGLEFAPDFSQWWHNRRSRAPKP